VVALGLVVALGAGGASAQAALRANGKLAFASGRDGDPEVYTMNANGSAQRRLTFNTGGGDFPLLDFWPSWAPDGERIVYTSFRGLPPNPDVFIMNADGSAPRRVTSDPRGDLDPAFFPDGRKIVFVREVPGESPDAPAASQDIWTINADGTGAKNLTPGPGRETEPAVSPDGKTIAFESAVGGSGAHESGNHEIFTIQADGRGLKRLTNTPNRREQHPSFSPDGTRIAFDDNFHAPPGAKGFIYSMKTNGTDVRQLTKRSDRHGLPSYSPDGQKISFTASEDVWTMDTDGSNQRRLTAHPAFDIQASWQPVPAFATKLRVRRARIDRDDRVLDVYAPITSRAQGDVDVTYQANGRTDTFDARVSDGDAVFDRIRLRQKITPAQARLGTGIVTIDYKGDLDTRPEQVRLRVAPRRAQLDVDRLSLIDGRLSARGSVTRRARGIVRFRFSYIDTAGNPQISPARATIQKNGDWQLDNKAVPPRLARRGGYLSILFTGDFAQRIGGEMLAYQLNPGQTRTPTTTEK